MDKLFTGVTKLLGSSVRLVEHTVLTQNEVGREGVVLWNKAPSLIDTITYIEFKEAIKRRQSKYYMYSHVLSYPDFCISLLCCLDYSLNHKVTTAIPATTYTAAWRAIDTISDISTDRVSSWVSLYRADRTARGYCNALGITLDNVSETISVISPTVSRGNNNDVSLMSSINSSDEVVTIRRTDDLNDNEKNTGRVWDSSNTPESQLYDLTNAHSEFNRRLFNDS